MVASTASKGAAPRLTGLGRTRSARATNAWIAVAAVVAGIGVALLSAGRDVQIPVISTISSIPLAGLAAVAAGGAAFPLVFRHWRLGFWAFLVWMPIEDLIRKFAGNDIRVYVVKDFLFVVSMLGLVRYLSATRSWRSAVRGVRGPLYALLAYSLAMAVPASLTDWRVAALGLRFNFFYLPLLAVGYFLTREASGLTKWARWMSVLACAVLSVGIIQAVVGPSFLSPGGNVTGLHNLVLERGVRSSSGSYSFVFQPTGTFVDPGRYASMALLGLVCTLMYFGMSTDRRRLALIARFGGIGIAIAALYAAAARATIVSGALLLTMAIAARRRGRGFRLVALVSFAVAAISLFFFFAPEQSATRASFFAQTLDPRATTSEWSNRLEGRTESLLLGVRYGGVFGRGTGTHSIGRQYLFGGEERSLYGLNVLESGWGSVAYELGAIGLLLWMIWTIAWFARATRCYLAVRGTPLGMPALVIIGWLFTFLVFGMFSGYQFFQNYVSNAFFWLLSGILFGLPTSPLVAPPPPASSTSTTTPVPPRTSVGAGTVGSL